LRPRQVAGGLACCIGGVALGFARPGSPGEPYPRHAPGIALATIGTVGDYPPPARRVVVDVDAEGEIAIGRARVAFEDLAEALEPFASSEREPDGSSVVAAVLRIDAAVSWRACVGLLTACAHARVRIHRIGFAVQPEDDSGEGVLFIRLPKDG
jgi:biopolymer transport protein ExbD